MRFSKQIIKAVGILLLSSWGCLFTSIQAQQTERSSKVFVKKAETADSSIEIRAAENQMIVSNAPVGSTIEIYNIIGTKIKEFEIKQPSVEYAVFLPKGYYIVRIADMVRKIVIR